MLGGEYIGPAHQHVRGNALLEFGDHVSAVQAAGKIDAVRNRRAEQELQRITV